MFRSETRKQRYDKKLTSSETYPISLCTVNFMFDDNLGFLIRSAACFGATSLNVIGSIQERKILNPLSGSLYDYVKINQFKNPREFLRFCERKQISIVSAEICNDAVSLEEYKFDFNGGQICIVVGNEESGVPQEILASSDKVFIPMRGAGYCLNTSQCANIMLYEAVKQFQKINDISRHRKIKNTLR